MSGLGDEAIYRSSLQIQGVAHQPITFAVSNNFGLDVPGVIISPSLENVLKSYNGFDPNRPSVVITHGWQPSGSYAGQTQGWQDSMASAFMQLKNQTQLVQDVNVFGYAWKEAFTSDIFNALPHRMSPAQISPFNYPKNSGLVIANPYIWLAIVWARF